MSKTEQRTKEYVIVLQLVDGHYAVPDAIIQPLCVKYGDRVTVHNRIEIRTIDGFL